MNIGQIAKICHDANRSYCESIGDNSQPSWEDAPDWQHQSSFDAVRFAINNPNAMPEDQHNAWLNDKEAAGWKYGKVKDLDKKEHPCFVPYEQLPVEQQIKDYLFRGIVHSLREFYDS